MDPTYDQRRQLAQERAEALRRQLAQDAAEAAAVAASQGVASSGLAEEADETEYLKAPNLEVGDYHCCMAVVAAWSSF
jgi:hypothetical protein